MGESGCIEPANVAYTRLVAWMYAAKSISLTTIAASDLAPDEPTKAAVTVDGAASKQTGVRHATEFSNPRRILAWRARNCSHIRACIVLADRLVAADGYQYRNYLASD